MYNQGIFNSFGPSRSSTKAKSQLAQRSSDQAKLITTSIKEIVASSTELIIACKENLLEVSIRVTQQGNLPTTCPRCNSMRSHLEHSATSAKGHLHCHSRFLYTSIFDSPQYLHPSYLLLCIYGVVVSMTLCLYNGLKNIFCILLYSAMYLQTGDRFSLIELCTLLRH